MIRLLEWTKSPRRSSRIRASHLQLTYQCLSSARRAAAPSCARLDSRIHHKTRAACGLSARTHAALASAYRAATIAADCHGQSVTPPEPDSDSRRASRRVNSVAALHGIDEHPPVSQQRWGNRIQKRVLDWLALGALFPIFPACGGSASASGCHAPTGSTGACDPSGRTGASGRGGGGFGGGGFGGAGFGGGGFGGGGFDAGGQIGAGVNDGSRGRDQQAGTDSMGAESRASRVVSSSEAQCAA